MSSSSSKPGGGFEPATLSQPTITGLGDKAVNQLLLQPKGSTLGWQLKKVNPGLTEKH